MTTTNSSANSEYIPISAKTESAHSVEYNSMEGSNWNISSNDLIFEKEIGRGAYGVVFKGQWRGTPGNV